MGRGRFGARCGSAKVSGEAGSASACRGCVDYCGTVKRQLHAVAAAVVSGVGVPCPALAVRVLACNRVRVGADALHCYDLGRGGVCGRPPLLGACAGGQGGQKGRYACSARYAAGLAATAFIARFTAALRYLLSVSLPQRCDSQWPLICSMWSKFRWFRSMQARAIAGHHSPKVSSACRSSALMCNKGRRCACWLVVALMLSPRQR